VYGISVYTISVQTVVETPSFLASAKAAGMSDDERGAVVETYATTPNFGDLIPGSGGARKARFAKAGMGKRGGYRVVSYYAATDVPVFLLAAFGKNQRANLSKAETNELRTILSKIANAWRASAARAAELRRATSHGQR